MEFLHFVLFMSEVEVVKASSKGRVTITVRFRGELGLDREPSICCEGWVSSNNEEG